MWITPLLALPLAFSLAPGQDLLGRLASPIPAERRAAARSIVTLEGVPAGIVHRLVDLLVDSDEQVAWYARDALQPLNEEARDALSRALASAELRFPAADVLATDEAGVQQLEAYLDGDLPAEARIDVLAALGRRGCERLLALVDEHPAEGLRALRRTMENPRRRGEAEPWRRAANDRVRNPALRRACQLLLSARLGPLQPDVARTVEVWLDGEDPALRESAAWVIGVSEVPLALPGLVRMLSAEEAILRATGAWALGHVLGEGRVTPDRLIIDGQKWVDAPFPMSGVGTDMGLGGFDGRPADPWIDKDAAWSLSARILGRPFSEWLLLPRRPPREPSRGALAALVPRLAELLDDPDPGVVQAAAWSLGSAGSDAAPAADALARQLEADDRAVRWTVALALADIGPPAGSAMEAAVRSLWDGGSVGEVYFLSTLGDVARDELVRALGHPDPSAVEFAVLGLGKLGADPRDFAQALGAAFERGQYSAAGLLLRCDAYGEGVLRSVLIGDHPLDLRGVAAFALGHATKPAAATRRALELVAEDRREDPDLRAAARASLEALSDR